MALVPYLIFISIILPISESKCSSGYGCVVSYCPKALQVDTDCSCTQCTCLSTCLTGTTCDELKATPACDPCIANPCPTNYECSSFLGSRTCVCNAGFTGYNCEFAIGNQCQSYPCLNGGTCSGTTTTYTCACPTGFRGTQCQTSGSVCSGVTCVNGTCIPVLDNTQGVCNCPTNWQGAACDEPVLIRSCGSACSGTCYKAVAVLNTTAFTKYDEPTMSLTRCKQLMDANPAAEFYIVAGSLCYLGSDPRLTTISTATECDNRCLGEWTQKCGDNENVRLYNYPYTSEPTQCTASICGPATTGYCVEKNNSYECVCKPGTSGTNCQTAGTPCTRFGCLNGATCLPTDDNSAARCICARGFSGDKCDKIDQCYFTPCKNGGSCSSASNAAGYTCSCNSAYYGDNCENYKACVSSPCANGGTCVNSAPGAYTCTCKEGWQGTECDVDVDECSVAAASTPVNELCENGGTCQNTIGSYNCACIPGTEGFDCSVNPDDCNMTYTGPDNNIYPNLCIYLDKNAECEDGFNNYTCACSAGYQGERCMEDVDECANAAAASEVLCENFGTCVNTLGSYHCNCIYGTYGFNCSENPDDCALSKSTIDGVEYPNECIARDKNANCTDGFGTYYCECTQYWTGPHCLTDVDECSFAPQPCVNFGTCVNTPGYYDCLCINGTEGHDCQINPDDCINVTACNTVDPFANCTDGFATFTCTCGPDYTLQYCDLEMIIYKVLQLIGGGSSNEAELIAMLRDLLRNPSKMKDLVPFVIGLQSRENRTKMSWAVEDLVMWMTYEEKKLDLQRDLMGWNDVVLGNCFTFNHFNNTDRSYLMRSDGAQGGLKAALKLNSEEYVPWTETTAIMTFIHPNTETIFSESPRYNAEPSAMTTIQSTESRYERLGGRYGKCVKSIREVNSYYYEGSYTTDVSEVKDYSPRSFLHQGCLRSCYQDEVKMACQCMDSRYPMPEKEVACELPDRKCVDSITAKGDVSTWAKCSCPLPCKNSQFDARYTVAPFVRSSYKCNAYNSVERLNDTSCGDLHGETDYVIVNVQVPRIIINIFQETPAWTLNRIIGNIGGLGGVVCGINLITFFEFGFFFFIQLPMTLFFNKRF
ncbi:hypothetical protein PRIPAC_80219 [Pristionchus pacificus]|nr:hypothetical protein PRIPAC_80219 [Pristionchus pacificus]